MEDKTYGTLVTDCGIQLIAAAVMEGKKINITDLAVGDGGGSYYKPNSNKADDGSTLRRIASAADTFDALTHHNNNGVRVGGLDDLNAAGRFGGGFLDAGFLFRLNLVFSTEDRGHRITFGNDIFAAFIEEQLCAAGLAVTLERHRLFGALDNLDGENAIVIAGATVKIFLADLELFHIDYPHI